MEIDVKSVHIGHEIDKRRIELGLSKSEFGCQIGVPQQHVNRILERETMETNKLLKVCQVLDFNFFALFCSMSHKIFAYLAAVTLNGNANNNIGDSELATQLSKEQTITDSLKATISLLREHIDSLNTQINRLDSNLKDKNVIIELLKERRQ